jgi:hypothetical protein
MSKCLFVLLFNWQLSLRFAHFQQQFVLAAVKVEVRVLSERLVRLLSILAAF